MGPSAPDKIPTSLGTLGTANSVPTTCTTRAAQIDPPTPVDQHTWLGTFTCDQVPGALRLSCRGPALYLWRRGTADQLARTCSEGRTYAGPGYTLTIPAAGNLTNCDLNAFTLDLDRAPALRYRIIRSDKP